jgi:hypothetical protein
MSTFLGRLVSTVDALLTWFERLDRFPWWKPVGATIVGTLYGLWAWATQLPPVIVTFIAIQVFTCLVLLFTFGPPLLRAFRRPSFSITIAANQLSLFSTVVPIYIENNASQARLRLHVTLVIPLSTGQDYQVDYEHILTIEPQSHLSTALSFIPKAPPFGPVFCYHEAYLLVRDSLSQHSVRVNIPGSFPPA